MHHHLEFRLTDLSVPVLSSNNLTSPLEDWLIVMDGFISTMNSSCRLFLVFLEMMMMVTDDGGIHILFFLFFFLVCNDHKTLFFLKTSFMYLFLVVTISKEIHLY